MAGDAVTRLRTAPGDTAPWTGPVQQLLRDLGTSSTGLTTAQSHEASRSAPPVTPDRHHTPWARTLLRQFTSPIIIILLIATLISIAVDDPVDGLIILTIIAVSGLLGFVQERRADAVMSELLSRVQIHADVLRDGSETEVPVQDVVRGDVVVLRAGDIVPADLRLLESVNLLVDESSVTGESSAVEKSAHPRDTATALPNNGVFLGTHIVSGTAHGVAVSVGRNTRFGSLVERLESADSVTAFEHEMTEFGLMLTRVMLVLVVAILVIDALLHRPFIESLLFALALAVGITPQLLPAIVVVSLSMGARRLAQEKVLVKRLDAIEDIGGMTMLCSDKTGTLTRGVVTLDRTVDIQGEPSDHVARLAGLNATLQRGYPNAMDVAIRETVSVPSQVRLIDEVPYDFERRRLSVLVDDGGPLLVTKGAVDPVLEQCTTAKWSGRVVPVGQVTERVAAAFAALSDQGYRVLAVASKPMPGAVKVTADDERDCVLEGLIAFLDPATDNAAEAVTRLRDLQVQVALVTGDNVHVATAVASSVGLPVRGALTGSQIQAMSDQELADAARSVRVFAQVDPLDKERIVTAMQGDGQTVGFLGDGINDAAALRRADVGISVESAADVSKHAASLVILDKDLDVVADGIRLGRRTFANTLKYVRVTISANFGNVVSMVVAAVFLPFLPMLPVQILLLNLLSDGPAMTISADRVDAEQERSPREWNTRDIRTFMVVFGLVSSAFDICVFVVLRTGMHAGPVMFHSGWFVLSLMTELIAMLVLRTAKPLWRSRPAAPLLVSSAVIAVVGFALPFTAAGAMVGLAALSVGLVGVIVGLSVAYVAANEITKRLWNRRSGAPW